MPKPSIDLAARAAYSFLGNQEPVCGAAQHGARTVYEGQMAGRRPDVASVAGSVAEGLGERLSTGLGRSEEGQTLTLAM